MRKFLLVILILAVIGGIIYSYYWKEEERFPPNTIPISGNIDVTDVDVSFKIGGRVEQRLVDEGEPIEEGQLVAFLESKDLLQEVQLRKAELEQAQAALQELENGFLPEEIAEAVANTEEAAAELERTRTDLRRQRNLLDKEVISQREYESSLASYRVSLGRFQAAQEELKRLRRGTRTEEIDQGKARVKQAEENLDIAQTRLNYAEIHSPLTGVVLTKITEPGEYAAPGTPIVTVADLRDVWLRAYINETDLGKVKLGQKVRVTTDTYPSKVYDGTISFISSEAEFTPKNIQTFKERVTLVYRIKVDIENPAQELKPGMPADGLILLNQFEGDLDPLENR